MQKGSYSIEQYLFRLKNIKELLIATSEFLSNNDFVVATLSSLAREYSNIRNVILTRNTSISLREFKEQLICAERESVGVPNAVLSFGVPFP